MLTGRTNNTTSSHCKGQPFCRVETVKLFTGRRALAMLNVRTDQHALGRWFATHISRGFKQWPDSDYRRPNHRLR